MSEPSAAPRRIRVAVVFGGRSSEHAVSCSTAASFLASIDRDTYDVVPIGIARDGRWVTVADDPEPLRLTADQTPEVASAAPHVLVPTSTADKHLIVAEPGEVPRDLGTIDVVFPLLHGPNGEDGALQGLLRLLGLPFVGSGVLGSAVSMDKLTMKALFASAGLEQVAYRGVTRHAYAADPLGVEERLGELGLPLFVKPANLGSSIGVTRVDEPSDLAAALETALGFDRRVIVEAAALGARELELAVLGNDEPQVSGVGEIVYRTAFYDYDTKYTDGKAELIIPAEVPVDVVRRAKELALRAFACVDAAGLARVDLFYLPDGRLLVNELNTMPGFTEHSMYPKLWQAAGLSYPDLIERLVRLALERR